MLSMEELDQLKAEMTNVAYFSKDGEKRKLGQDGLTLIDEIEGLRFCMAQAKLYLDGRMHVGEKPPPRAFHT